MTHSLEGFTRIALALAWVAACAPAAESAHRDRDTPDLEPQVLGGAPDASDGAVVLLLIQDSISNPTKQSHCTGTVVSPHVVLTAAHCLDPAATQISPAHVAVFLGDDFNDASQANDGALYAFEKEHHFDPAFDAAVLGSEHDFGVVITTKTLPAPVALNRGEAPAVGSDVRAVGYGLSDIAASDSWGARLATTAPIAGLTSGHFYLVDSGVCVGDSGGPSIATLAGGATLVGVHSYGEHAATCIGKAYDSIVGPPLLAYVDPLIATHDPGFLPSGTGGGGGTGAGGSGGQGLSGPEPANETDAGGGCALARVTRDARAPEPARGAASVLVALAGLALCSRRARRA